MRLKFISQYLKIVSNTLKKRSRKTYILAGVVVVFFVLQFAVPPNYITPRTKLGALEVGLKHRGDLQIQLAEKSRKIDITLDSQKEEFTAQEIGITTDVNETIARLPVVSSKDKLIPFKPLYKTIKKTIIQPVVKRDKKAIQAFAAVLSEHHSKQPVDARADMKNDELIITQEKSGVFYDASTIERALMNGDPISGNEITITAEKTAAKIQEKDLLPLQEDFKKKTGSPLKVVYGNTTKIIEPSTLKKWFTVTQEPSTGVWSLAANSPNLEEHIVAWSKEYNIAPGITQVSFYDDVETSRKIGAAGRALNPEAIKEQLKAWFEKPTDTPVSLATKVVPAKIVATRTYSRSSAQLQAKLDAWVASHAGQYQIAIRELGGRGREASHNIAQQTVMASTYKIFLAFVAYRQAENGALNLSTQVHDGKNIEQCIELMIVNSNNDCSVALGRYIGWAKVDEVIAAAGFQGTRLNNYDASGNLSGDKLVNALEQAKFLAQLSAGSLINGANTGRLLDYMKRQTYRAGIPAGSRGAVVADKVGFLGAYIHDVGIVYGSKSTYALVIMSGGSSWANIKDLAQAVYDFMNE